MLGVALFVCMGKLVLLDGNDIHVHVKKKVKFYVKAIILVIKIIL